MVPGQDLRWSDGGLLWATVVGCFPPMVWGWRRPLAGPAGTGKRSEYVPGNVMGRTTTFDEREASYSKVSDT